MSQQLFLQEPLYVGNVLLKMLELSSGELPKSQASLAMFGYTNSFGAPAEIIDSLSDSGLIEKTENSYVLTEAGRKHIKGLKYDEFALHVINRVPQRE